MVCAAATGAILTYGSEMLFWSAPPTPPTPAEMAATWLAYSVCAWATLCAAAWAGISTWGGLMLAGSVFGWLIEGIAVDTVYSALPWTIPFTAMSWHALVSVIGVFALVRLSAGWRITRQFALMCALGLGFGIWAQFRPLERGIMPPPGVTWTYLLGLGLAVPLANHLLDRLPARYPYDRRETRALAAILALLWGARLALSANPAVLVLPVLVLPTLGLMRRGGTKMRGMDLPARPERPLRHWLFFIVPVLTAFTANLGWQTLGGIETNWPMALVLTALALILFGRAGLRALRGQAL